MLIFSGLVATSLGQVSDEWITTIYEDDFGQPVTFYCNTSLESNQPPTNSTPAKWMFNDLTNMDKGCNSTKYAISEDGYTMTILSAEQSDFGIYHCMLLTPESEWYLIKLGLNVRGPYYEDLWEKYRRNFIIGISAFAIFLVTAVSIILIYKKRYIFEEEESLAPPGVGLGNGYNNKGFTIEDGGKMRSSGNGQYYEPPADYENTML